jgi:hypothetical protein
MVSLILVCPRVDRRLANEALRIDRVNFLGEHYRDRHTGDSVWCECTNSLEHECISHSDRATTGVKAIGR